MSESPHPRHDVTLGDMCPDVCPPTLTDMYAGFIAFGVFYTSSSVVRHFFELQGAADRERGRPAPHVYFIQSVDEGPVKIGTARHPPSRLDEIQHMCPVPLHILGIIKNGGRQLEAELHARFHRDRLHGEWFKPTPEILGIIP